MKQNEDRAREIATILCPCAECSSYETRYEAIAAALNSQSEIIREKDEEIAILRKEMTAAQIHHAEQALTPPPPEEKP